MEEHGKKMNKYMTKKHGIKKKTKNNKLITLEFSIIFFDENKFIFVLKL